MFIPWGFNSSLSENSSYHCPHLIEKFPIMKSWHLFKKSTLLQHYNFCPWDTLRRIWMPWNLLSFILVLLPQGKEKLCKKRFDEILSSFPATPLGLFVPKCLDDGGYRANQCHNSTGYCWCVDDFGNELTGTRVRGQQNCSGEQS